MMRVPLFKGHSGAFVREEPLLLLGRRACELLRKDVRPRPNPKPRVRGEGENDLLQPWLADRRQTQVSNPRPQTSRTEGIQSKERWEKSSPKSGGIKVVPT